MKEFPSILNVKNKDRFNEVYYNRVLCYLRQAIYDHVISKDENSYFDLEIFGRGYFSENGKQGKREELVEKMSSVMVDELTSLGWKCKTSFRGTGLFIYSSEKPPPSCWDGGF